MVFDEVDNDITCIICIIYAFLMVFRYVSDQAYNGYKAYCQNKLLQCISPKPCLPRSYPPCYLEWKAAKKRANMAIEAVFPDGEDTIKLF